MSGMETLQPEAGDDRNRDSQIERLNEMYYGADALALAGVGEIVLRHKKVGIPTERLLLHRMHVRLRPDLG